MQLWIKAFGLTLFELHLSEGFETDSIPTIMVNEVSSIPVFTEEEQTPMEDDDEDRIKMGFQQKNGK